MKIYTGTLIIKGWDYDGEVYFEKLILAHEDYDVVRAAI